MINSYNLKENKSDKFIQSVLYFYTPWGGGFIALQVCPNKTCPIDNERVT